MALNATIYKAELQVSDMDRHYYATHALTLARHPSETDERLMVRLLAFALHADERLEFGKGISSDDEPDLWRKDLTGEILQWIELGQPDEQRIRKACGRARQVVVVNYGGRASDIWWEKNAAQLARAKNLTVIDIPAPAVVELTALAERGMNALAAVDTDISASAPTSTVRMPKRCINAAANGPTSPYRKMPIAADSEITSRGQPNACSSGTISTPGVERRPAATSRARNTTAVATKA